MIAIDGYSTEDILHQGKKFTIYRATRQVDQNNVILKTLRNEQPAAKDVIALQQEYRLLASLHSAKVITVHELLKQDNQIAIVLEDVGGIDLQAYLASETLTLENFFIIALQIVEALSVLHSQHIIHKDINPSNIIVNRKTLDTKLIDLGISVQLDQELQDNILLKELEGTLAYISPEQTGRMNRALDYRTDFYSLGITFYEMLTGQLPFTAKDPLELIHCHIAKHPPLVSKINAEIPKQLALLIAKLMAKTPEERYASTAGIKADLIECQTQWQKEHDISAFKLGTHDVHDHLTLSQKLYGREVQLDELLSAYERICQGGKELLLVSGYSGIGKTSLVKELYKPITQHKGYFISGKYDQLKRATPYSAFIEAFEDLMRRFLAEPQERLEELKQKMLNALGKNGRVVTAVIPNLKLIIGEQPAVPDLPPIESQNRFLLTFQSFVRVLAQSEHPLTLFIDDLQWVDSASLPLLTTLLFDIDLKYFLIIGSYRNNEVAADHPLTLALQDIQKSNVPCTTITPTPLKLNNIQQLLADSLSHSTEDTLSLAKLLLHKTEGNPFFINEFLKRLYQDKHLRFSYTYSKWEWDLEGIQQQDMTDNVVDLLTIRIRQLSHETQELLKLAACIGHIFDIETLVRISGYTLSDATKYLWPAIKSNLILPSSHKKLSDSTQTNAEETTSYRFAHDKIQQSAYQFIEESKRQETHLLIGRLLLKDKPLQENDDYLFDVLTHFNKALTLITDLHEKNTIASANLWAAKKAKSATAHDSAKEYCRAGISLLDSEAWNNNYPLIFALHKELMECGYLTGHHDETSNLFKQLLINAKNIEDKIAIYRVQISMFETLNKEVEALTVGLEGLKALGLVLPRNPNKFDILKIMLRIKFQLIKHQLKGNKLQPTTNKQIIITDYFLTHLRSCAYMINPNLFLLIACHKVYTALKYGYTRTSVLSFIGYAYILIQIMKDFKDGFKFEALSREIKEAHPDYFIGEHIEKFARVNFIDYLKLPFGDCFNNYMQVYLSCREKGDMVYGNYSFNFCVLYEFYAGKPLSEGWKLLQNFKAFRERTKVRYVNEIYYTVYKSYEYLMNDSTIKLLDPEKLEIMTKGWTNGSEKASVYFHQLKLNCILGKHDYAFKYHNLYKDVLKFNEANLESKLSFFYSSLCQAISLLNAPKNNQRQYNKGFKTSRKQLKFWASHFPINLHMYALLIDALSAQINNNIPLAMELFDKAIHEAKKREHLELIALGNEYAARFYIAINRIFIAKSYMNRAHYTYHQWGAKTKVKLLEHEFPGWFQDSSDIIPLTNKTYTVTTTATTSLSSFDSLSIFKSAQVLASEINLEQLLLKMLALLLENAGAQRAVLLALNKGQWYVKAEGTLQTHEITLDLSKPVASQMNLPIAIISYAERTKELVLVQNDQERERRYQQDAYLKHQQPQSILALPIIHLNQLKYLLYFENKDVSHAFTPENINTLQLLASQAAISLENAKLYHQATHDILTGLANRSLLQYTFSDEINQKIPYMAILFLDLDGFKRINDTLGHEIGDKLLIYFAAQLKQSITESDLAVRLGGDEFVILLKSAADINNVKKIASQILQRLQEAVLIAGHELKINTSIGISLYPEHGHDIDTLLKLADTALYRAKTAGKGQFQIFTQKT